MESLFTFHLYLANRFAVKVNGKNYLRFVDKPNDITAITYMWENEKFRKEVIP